MNFAVAELYDANLDKVQVAQSIFKHFGAVSRFHGEIATLLVDHDFLLIKQALQTPGMGRVLVIDGGGALDCALLGDRLAGMAMEQKWAGVVVNGCVRDVQDINNLAIGVKALNTCPIRPAMEGHGDSNIEVEFAGVVFRPGEYLYADLDGILTSDEMLSGD